MKNREFKKWLQAQGVRCEEGKKHTKLYFNNCQSTLPRHAGEIDERLRNAIIKQLKLG